jgi:hypothetical protein
MSDKSVYETLAEIDVSEHVEKKGQFNYLSWAWAWGIVKKYYPLTKRTILKDKNENLFHTDGKTCWVEVTIDICGHCETDTLPILDNRNQPIPLNAIDSMKVNTSIQRSTVKALALHGLGLNIYAGEDLPMIATTIGLEGRVNLLSSYPEGVLAWFEQQNNCKISEQPEASLADIQRWCDSAYMGMLKRDLTDHLKRRMKLDPTFVPKHASSSVSHHLNGVAKVEDCNDIELLKAYDEYTREKIDEMTKKEGESNE